MAGGTPFIGAAEQMAGNIGAEGEGIAQFITGLENEKKDKRDLNALHQPFYQIQSEYFQNRNIAGQAASGGTPAATKQFQTQEAQRGLGAGLGDILEAGGDVNAASLLLSQYNNNIGKAGAADAEQHMQNIQYFMNANKELAGQKTTQWSVNEYQPYEAKLKELKESVATDKQNIWGGATSAISSMIGAGTGSQNKGLTQKLFSSAQDGGIQDPYANLPGLAPTGATGGSPAANISQIDPNSFSSLVLAGT